MLMVLTYWMPQSARPQGGNARRDVYITTSSDSGSANACFRDPHATGTPVSLLGRVARS